MARNVVVELSGTDAVMPGLLKTPASPVPAAGPVQLSVLYSVTVVPGSELPLIFGEFSCQGDT